MLLMMLLPFRSCRRRESKATSACRTYSAASSLYRVGVGITFSVVEAGALPVYQSRRRSRTMVLERRSLARDALEPASPQDGPAVPRSTVVFCGQHIKRNSMCSAREHSLPRGSSTFERIPTVGLKLLERRHAGPPCTIGFVLWFRLGASSRAVGMSALGSVA